MSQIAGNLEPYLVLSGMLFAIGSFGFLYLLAFEIASVLILAAVIGGLYLAMEPKADEAGEELP